MVLDNATVHRTEDIQSLVSSRRNEIQYLPPYSPMLNQIEEIFSKVKLSARNILADSANQLNLKDVIEISLANVRKAM